MLDGEDLFPDNWIYIHEPDVHVGRIQNYRSWSPWMVPDPDTACVGLEYFAFKGDDLWTMDDDDLVALATRELEQLGLARPEQVRRGYVVRVPLAYPMYDEDYAERVATIREWLDPLGTNFQQVGRNGLHRYNNSDHSMLSAMRAVDNVLHARRPRHLGGQRRVLPTTRSRPTPTASSPTRSVPGAPVDERGAGARARLAALRPAAPEPCCVPGGRLGGRSGWRVVWWASRQQMPELPAASVALPRLAAALALYALATALRGERWLRLLRDAGAPLSRTDAYAVTVVGYMGNNALPARAGDILKSVLSSRQTETPTADGFGTLVAERVLDARRARARLRGPRHHAAPAARRRGLDARGGRRRARSAAAAAAAFLGRDTGAGRAVQELAARLLGPDAAPVVADRRRPARALGRALAGRGLRLRRPRRGGRRCTSRCSTASTSWPWPTSSRSSPPLRATSGTFDAAVLLGVRLVAGGTHAAALAYAVVVRFVLFVPITLVGLVALVVRYGGLRRMSVALRRPAPRCRRARSSRPSRAAGPAHGRPGPGGEEGDGRGGAVGPRRRVHGARAPGEDGAGSHAERRRARRS